MVEINNQRKAFLDMLAWSEEFDNGRQKTRNHGLWRHCRRRAIYWLLRSPSQTCHAKPKTQINRRRTLPASFPLVGCLPQAAWPERLLSRKWITWHYNSQAWRCLYDWSWRCLLKAMWWLRQYLGCCRGGYGRFSTELTAWLQNSKKRAERSERLMYEQSHRDYLRSGYLHVVCLSWSTINHYRDNAITYKAQRDKNGNWRSWQTRQLPRYASAYSMQNTRRGVSWC